MSRTPDPPDSLPDHPTGTLAIVLVYGVLFVAGFLLTWFALFLPRGGVR